MQDWIYLFAGSVRGEEQVKQAELDWLQDYLVRGKQYTTYATEAEAPDAASWRISIYNPDSWAYACDLDSNGHISQRDYDILTSRFNWLRTTSDYNWTKVDTSGKKTSTLPFGFGGGKTALGGDWSALFALDALEEAYPLDADPFWDAPGDGEEAELPGTYVDEEGNLLTEDQVEAGDAMRELEKLFNSADSTPQSPTSPGGLQDLIGDGEEQETPGGGMGSLPGTGIIAPLPPTDSATPEEEIQPDDDNLDGEPPAAEDSAPSGSSAGKENAWWEEEEEEPLR